MARDKIVSYLAPGLARWVNGRCEVIPALGVLVKTISMGVNRRVVPLISFVIVAR